MEGSREAVNDGKALGKVNCDLSLPSFILFGNLTLCVTTVGTDGTCTAISTRSSYLGLLVGGWGALVLCGLYAWVSAM